MSGEKTKLNEEKLNVVLVDDKPYFRKGMRDLLMNRFNNRIDTIEEVSNGEEFLLLIDFFPANLVFMDIEMPHINGIEAVRQAHTKHPEIKIYALSAHDDFNYIKSMNQAGVEGFLSKNEEIGSRLNLIINNLLLTKNTQLKDENKTKIDILINGLIFECPLKEEICTCPFAETRKLNIIDRINWLRRLSKIEKLVLVMDHKKCIHKRE
jgi:YesN/AraC family two-component response regulator